MLLKNSINIKLWQASRLALSIEPDGKLPNDYKTKQEYLKAGFIGDLYTCAEGIDNIHAGLIGVSDIGIIIAFRGTNGKFFDWLNNFAAFQINYQNYTDKQNRQVKVHAGFYNAFISIKEQMKDYLIQLQNEYPKAKIYLTGHSKGGAMTVLMSTYLQLLNLQNGQHTISQIVTFGAPRLGNEAFKSWYMKQLHLEDIHTRIESCRDLVPHIPFTAQEKLLPSAMTNVVNITIIKEILSLFRNLPDYYPVGKLEVINFKDVNVPCNTSSPNGETLNSLYCVLDKTFKGDNVFPYHDEDYNKLFS